jgi:hypothetical protein
MTPAERKKLIRILGLLGSDHAGERAAAALKAHKLVEAAGLDWSMLLTPATTRTVVRRVRDADADYREAAESRIRQLKTTTERQERQIRALRTRVNNLADRERKSRAAESGTGEREENGSKPMNSATRMSPRHPG